MKQKKNVKINKYIVILLAILASIVTLYLVKNTNNKLFITNFINQKANAREIVNIPDQDLKNFLLTNFKINSRERGEKLELSDRHYIKPSNENEIYRDEMEKIIALDVRSINTKETPLNLTGLEKAVNISSYLRLMDNKIENIEPLRWLLKLKNLSLDHNNIENFEPLSKLKNLSSLGLQFNRISNLEPLKNITSLASLWLYNEEVNVTVSASRFNLPVLKKYNGQIIDIAHASNGILRKNSDGTYSFTRKLNGTQIINLESGIEARSPRSNGNWNHRNPLYVLKINIEYEKISKTIKVKDNSNTLLNNDKERKVLPVIKRNGQVITNTNTNNVGHRTNNDELLTYTWNELLKTNDDYVEYNYEVTFDISGLPEGYRIEPNVKTADNQADFNITYVSPKIPVTKEIPVIGGNKEILPQSIKAIVKNDKGLPEKEVTAILKADKSGYVVNENMDKTNANLETVTYKVVPKTDLPNYTKTVDSYTYTSPRINITVEKNWVNGETVRPETITAKLKRKLASENTYTFVQDVTVRKNNNWRLVVSNLEKTDANGKDYTYIVEEETNVDNFNASYSGLTITNTYTVPNISKDFSVRVTGGKKDILPNEVEVTVKNNNGLADKVVNATLNRDKTAYEVKGLNLAKTQNDGTVVTYKVVPKTDITNYIKDEITGYTYVSPKANITVEKNWVNGETVRPEIITVKLKRKLASENKYTFVQDVTVRKDNNWRLIVSNQDKTDTFGNDYTYIVEEETNIENFTPSYSGLTVTNTYTSQKISVTKNITINGGDRSQLPLSIKAIISNNRGIAEKEVTATLKTDKSAYVVNESLDKTDVNGNLVTYKVTPKTEITNYIKTDDGYIYVSPKEIVTKEVPVTGGNKELLPQSIKVIVKNDKGLPEKEVDATLKADKSGYVINENLDKTTNAGENITYTVVPKTEITNYVKSDNGYTYVTPRINITVEKNWVNGETVRPETITAKLKRKIASDNVYTFVQDVTVRKENNWRLVVSNLEKTDANGNDYTYIVEEETNVANFNASYSGLTITNTYTVPNISKDFSVRVTGGKKDILPNEVEVTVKNDKGLAEKVVNATLNRDKTAYEVKGLNLAKTQNDGTVVTYKVVPKTDITNYEKDVVGENGYSYVIPKINFEKTINKNSGKEISLIVKLKKNGVLVTPEKSVTINSGETAIFTDLDKTDFDGNDNTYSVEVVPNGTLEDGYSINTKPNGDVEVLYTSPKTSVTKDITVNGGDKSRLPNEITVTISNDKGLPEKEVTATLKADKSGYVVNENLEKTDANGDIVTYKVTPKTDITNYTKTDDGYTYVSPKKIFEKVIPKENGKPVEVKVVLTKNGVKVEPEKAVIVNTGETVRFTDLDKTDFNGVDYNYGIIIEPSNNGLPEGYTVDNTTGKVIYTSPKVTVNKEITVIDGNKNVLPNEIDVRIENNRGLSSINKKARLNVEKTAYVVSESLDKTTTSADEITYTVVPVTEIANYTKTNESYTYVSPQGEFKNKVLVNGGNKNVLPNQIDVKIKNDKNQPERTVKANLTSDKSGYEITENLPQTTNTGENITYRIEPLTQLTNYVLDNGNYRYVTPRINITVEKNWVNGETVRPETITAKLKRKIASDNAYTFVQDVTVRKENNWRLVVSNLEKTDANGNDYTYIVEEETNVSNFTPSYSGLTITNTYVIAKESKKLIVNVNGGNKETLPQTIQVTIKNDKGLAEKVVNATLNQDKTAYEVTENLDTTKPNGERINYTAVPKGDIPNYTKDETGGYTYVSPKAPVSIVVPKENGKPIEVKVVLTINGVKVEPEKVVTVNTGEIANFGNLDSTDANGNPYRYGVEIKPSENGLPEGYSIQNGKVVYTSPKTTFEKVVPKENGKSIPVKVKLLRNGVEVQGKEVTVNTGEKAVFNNLDKTDKDGNPYTYDIKIDETSLPEGYSIDNATGKVVYTSPKVLVTKDIAVNGGDKSRLPNEITVTISNDKGLPEKEVKATLKPDKSGYVVNENLDKTNSRGENVTYTVVPKTDIPNYIKTADAYTYVSPKVNVTVEKNWVNGETVRPETITAKLKRKIASDNTYTFVQDVTVRKDNNWQLVVANLDKTDTNGNDYTYIVEEETNVSNFTPSYSGLIVTNTYTSPKKQLDLRVEVIGGDKNTLPNEVEVEILDKTDENNKIVVKKVKLSLNQDKTAYVGTEEVNTTKPDGTNITYGRNTVTDIDSLRYIRNNDGNYVYTPNIINVSGNVTYVNGNTLWEEIHVKLYKNGQEVPNSEKVLTKESFLNSVNGNKSTLPVEYTGLNETENDGSLNTYEIKAETNVNLFTKTVTGNNTTYTFASEIKQIPYNITYKDGDINNRPEVTVILKKKDNDTSAFIEVTRKTNTANNKNSVVFENIPSKDEKGRDNEYTFEVTVPKNSNYVVENNNGNYVVKYVSPKITFTAAKEWVNGPSNKPTINIGLLRDGNSLGDNFVKTVVTENNKTNASVSWENLDKTDANGVDYVYSISEIGEVENYQRRYEGNNKVVNTYVSPKTEVGINVNKNGGKATKAKVKLLKNGVEVPNTLKETTLNTKVTYTNLDKTDVNGNDNRYEIVVAEEVTNYVQAKDNSGNITLTYVSPKVKLTVEKQWIDGENLVPESITAALRRQEGINLVEAYTFELKKSENWTKEVEVDETDFQGDKYEYHLAEKTKVENFTDVVKGLRITNVYKVPKQELTLTKVWTGGKTRKNVTLELKKADGTFVDEKETTKVDENTFKAVFSNVNKTELNGNKINFKANEKETFENYVKSVNGLTVTNTYVSPKINVSKTIKIEVPKEVFKKTTKTIEVQLYKNGKPVGETKVINVDDIDQNGKVVVNYPNMDKTDFDGNNYDYDVKLAKQIDGYKEKGQDEMTIEKDIETEDKEVSVEFSGGKLRPNVVVELLRDGKVIKTETVTNNKHVFKNIELNDKFAHEYKYEIRVKNESELNNKNYKVNIETNANMKKAKVTLTYVIPKINFPINILWQGKGKNNPTVKIQLLKNGVPTDKVVELNGNGEYIFKDLDKTDFSENEYEYKISVVGEIPGYYYELTPNGKSLIVTRNDLKGKVLPYAGLKENMTMSYVVLAVLIAGFVYSNKAKRNINKLENISDIRRNNLRNRR